MLKKFKEYLGLPTIAIGGLDSYSPMVSLGKQDDRPPRGKGSRDSRATGLVANYTTQGVGTMIPMLSTPTQPIIVKKELKDQARGFKKKILTKLGKPIKDYLKSKEKKEDLGAAHKIYQSYIDTNKKKD